MRTSNHQYQPSGGTDEGTLLAVLDALDGFCESIRAGEQNSSSNDWDTAIKDAEYVGAVNAWKVVSRMLSEHRRTVPAITREDFRLRKSGDRYRIYQRIGSGWEPLSDTFATRQDALGWINAVVTR